MPAGANGYFLPAVTFGAPQTTSSSVARAGVDLGDRRWSESGCGASSTTRATTTSREIVAQRDELVDRAAARGDEIAQSASR